MSAVTNMHREVREIPDAVSRLLTEKRAAIVNSANALWE